MAIKRETATLSGVTGVIKPPVFDGETVWSKYRRQFEATEDCITHGPKKATIEVSENPFNSCRQQTK